MPNHCVVPGCETNYQAKSDEKVAIFRVPNDDNVRQLWQKAITRDKFALKRSHYVCDKHFVEDDILIKNEHKDQFRNVIGIVFVGDLPPDFLRIAAASQQQQEAADQQAALALQQQIAGVAAYAHNTAGRLSITVAQAKLAKNYGMTRMDPYARLRVGHCVYETHTDPNGGKNPRWNKVIQCLLPQGVTSIYIEIYDECSFTMDELIAWVHIPIPQAVLSGETHDDWYPLTGKMGEGQEGMINLVLSYSNTPMVLQNATAAPYMYPSVAPVVMVPTPLYGMRPQYAPVTVQYGGVPPQQPGQHVFAEQELKQIEEMFPNMDKEVVKSVYEANRGNKDATINSLLQMSE